MTPRLLPEISVMNAVSSVRRCSGKLFSANGVLFASKPTVYRAIFMAERRRQTLTYVGPFTKWLHLKPHDFKMLSFQMDIYTFYYYYTLAQTHY